MLFSTHLTRFVQYRKPIPSNKNGTLPIALLPISRRVFNFPSRLRGQPCKFKQAIVRSDGNDDSSLCGIETEGPRRDIRAAELADAQKADI